jgi:cell division protease FtsH
MTLKIAAVLLIGAGLALYLLSLTKEGESIKLPAAANAAILAGSMIFGLVMILSTAVPLFSLLAQRSGVADPDTRAPALSEETLRYFAAHEAGHAVVAAEYRDKVALMGSEILMSADEEGRGAITGYQYKHQQGGKSRSDLVMEIAITLGGYVAEKIVFGEPQTGGIDDLKKASIIAKIMVRELGMGATTGPLVCSDETDCGEATYTAFDVEALKILEDAKAKAHAILTARRPGFDRVAKALQEKRMLAGEEMYELLDQVPASQ